MERWSCHGLRWETVEDVGLGEGDKELSVGLGKLEMPFRRLSAAVP